MSFGENLQSLRKKHSVTQEELADELQVSRQTVSKWEQDACYPEMDKLIALCKRFSVTMDSLVQGKIEADAQETLPAPPAVSRVEYDRRIKTFALAIASGVCLILLGVALLIGELALEEGYGFALSPLGTVLLIACIAVAVGIFVWFGMRHETFLKNVNPADYQYEKEEVAKHDKLFAAAITAGVSLLLTGILLIVLFSEKGEALTLAITALFFVLIAFAVFLFIYFGIQHDKFHGKLQSGNRPQDKAEKICGAVCTCIMLSATIVFLLLGFLINLWHPAWVAFPVGGILCAIVSAIKEAHKK